MTRPSARTCCPNARPYCAETARCRSTGPMPRILPFRPSVREPTRAVVGGAGRPEDPETYRYSCLTTVQRSPGAPVIEGAGCFRCPVSGVRCPPMPTTGADRVGPSSVRRPGASPHPDTDSAAVTSQANRRGRRRPGPSPCSVTLAGGRVAERTNAHASKACEVKASGGSNPPPSARSDGPWTCFGEAPVPSGDRGLLIDEFAGAACRGVADRTPHVAVPGSRGCDRACQGNAGMQSGPTSPTDPATVLSRPVRPPVPGRRRAPGAPRPPRHPGWARCGPATSASTSWHRPAVP